MIPIPKIEPIAPVQTGKYIGDALQTVGGAVDKGLEMFQDSNNRKALSDQINQAYHQWNKDDDTNIANPGMSAKDLATLHGNFVHFTYAYNQADKAGVVGIPDKKTAKWFFSPNTDPQTVSEFVKGVEKYMESKQTADQEQARDAAKAKTTQDEKTLAGQKADTAFNTIRSAIATWYKNNPGKTPRQDEIAGVVADSGANVDDLSANHMALVKQMGYEPEKYQTQQGMAKERLGLEKRRLSDSEKEQIIKQFDTAQANAKSVLDKYNAAELHTTNLVDTNTKLYGDQSAWPADVKSEYEKAKNASRKAHQNAAHAEYLKQNIVVKYPDALPTVAELMDKDKNQNPIIKRWDPYDEQDSSEQKGAAPTSTPEHKAKKAEVKSSLVVGKKYVDANGASKTYKGKDANGNNIWE